MPSVSRMVQMKFTPDDFKEVNAFWTRERLAELCNARLQVVLTALTISVEALEALKEMGNDYSEVKASKALADIGRLLEANEGEEE